MKKRLNICLASFLALVGGNTAFAGDSTGIVVIAPVAPATPVPSLSVTMVIALALLMMVIAVRIFRSGKANMNRIASVAVLAGGLFMGGYAIKSYASGVVTPTGPGACTTGETINYSPEASPLTFNNSCPNALVVTENTASCQGDPVILGNCQGSVINAGDDCDLSRCDLRD